MNTTTLFVFNAVIKEEYRIFRPEVRFEYGFPLKSGEVKLAIQSHITQYFNDKADLESVFDLSAFKSWWWSDELSAATTLQLAFSEKYYRDFAEGDFSTRNNTFYTEEDLIAFGRFITQRPITYQDVLFWKREENIS